jgi:2'-5' RNA ligase superfamily
MTPADQAWANALRKQHYSADRNHVHAHITLFHHLPPAHLPEIKSRLAMITRQYPAPYAWLSDVIRLDRGAGYRVESPELLSMREILAEAFCGLLIAQDQGIPMLHITVQNKVEPAAARALYTQLSCAFEPRALNISGLTAQYYRGGPWQAIQTWPFRG